MKKHRCTQRLPHIPPQQPQPTEDSHPGPSGTTGGESSLGGQGEGGSGETGQSPIGSGAGGSEQSEPQTVTINRETFNKLLTRMNTMEQKLLLLEQEKKNQDNEMLRLENELIETQQELGRVRSQPPAGSSSTQQPSNVRLEDLQNDLVQLGTLVNELRTGFSDDFVNQGTARAAQGLDIVVRIERKVRFNLTSHSTN